VGLIFFKADDTRHKWIPINPISIYNQNLVASNNSKAGLDGMELFIT